MISAKEAKLISGKRLPSICLPDPVNRKVAIMPEHPRMDNYFNSNHCIVAVHPGFAAQKNSKTEEMMLSLFGNYDEYCRNITSLIRNASKTNPLLMLIDVNDNSRAYSEEFLPPHRSMMLFTEKDSSRLIDFLKIPSQKKIDQSEIYHYLKKNGVEEVWMCGEYSRGGDYNNGDDFLGCLRAAAFEFYIHGFEVKGIKGCIYPAKAPENEDQLYFLNDSIFKDQVEV